MFDFDDVIEFDMIFAHFTEIRATLLFYLLPWYFLRERVFSYNFLKKVGSGN